MGPGGPHALVWIRGSVGAFLRRSAVPPPDSDRVDGLGDRASSRCSRLSSHPGGPRPSYPVADPERCPAPFEGVVGYLRSVQATDETGPRRPAWRRSERRCVRSGFPTWRWPAANGSSATCTGLPQGWAARRGRLTSPLPWPAWSLTMAASRSPDGPDQTRQGQPSLALAARPSRRSAPDARISRPS